MATLGALHLSQFWNPSSRAFAATTPLTAAQIKERLQKFKGHKMVAVSWGGSFQEAQRKALFQPFAEQFGVKVVEDGPTNNAKIKAMVKAGNVTWDVVDVGAQSGLLLGRQGYLEELDYSIIDARDVVPGVVNKWSVGTIFYSTILAYRSDVFSGDTVPKKVADFWDVKTFPGRRCLQDSPFNNLVFALEADGVPYDQIYPLTDEKIKRAFRKLDEIKPHISVWWRQGAQPPQLLTDKEVVMSTAWNGRIFAVQKEGVPVKIVWDGAHLAADSWCIPKGSKKKDLAMLFIAWATLPENNIRTSYYISYGPTNRKAFPLVSKEMAPDIPTSAENFPVQVVVDYDWWGDNLDKMNELWREWKLS
jgi:putative spermidine/putrescine transport system substrate-binding protein